MESDSGAGMGTGKAVSPLRARVFRAAMLALGWSLAAVPLLLGVVPCPSARWFHVPCPGCGMQRAVHLFLKGDFAGSLAMNALAVPIALSLVAIAGVSVVAPLAEGTGASRFIAPWTRGAIGAFVVLQVLSAILWALRFGGLFGGPVSV